MPGQRVRNRPKALSPYRKLPNCIHRPVTMCGPSQLRESSQAWANRKKPQLPTSLYERAPGKAPPTFQTYSAGCLLPWPIVTEISGLLHADW
ncbi:hypothetical protein XELAEV_18033682mg [Xenopus laevis]|uniref:Uncharacterized protein n=1 Tax=Xenopus laevis TaxID=8355 RepID=A0A974CM30_XENLA|nr:hypothetical protein XELAEV_18033682mg [Xenopus laevis]